MLLVSNLIIILSIVAGFAGVVYRDTRAYQQLAENQLENIVSLADIDISKNIENSMNKPVMVSKTMANDEFLKTWLTHEPEKSANSAYLGQLYSYLKAYQVKYNYTTVFCVSAQTGHYYYQDGLNKTVSKNDEHDIWYYNFIESGHEYDLEVDTNQANHNNVTVFINFRVEGDDGQLLGVIGVGLQASFIEDTIRSFERDYDLSVYVINVGGAKNSFAGSTDVFISQDSLAGRTGINEEIQLNKSEQSTIQWYTSGGQRKCLITKYDYSLGWYLVLEKDTYSISSAFQERVLSSVAFMLISLVACIAVTTAVFLKYNQRMVAIENTDELTGLWNRKLFYKQYLGFARKHRDQKKSLFMLDVDHFKQINDTCGHVFGNAVLKKVGENLRATIDGNGIAARWGGDEFLGVLAVDSTKAEQILSQFMETLAGEKMEYDTQVTVSVGIVEVNEELGAEEWIRKVDEALYRSKEGGRNRITVGSAE
jgi:diguanylate cyclase (GGDEF)-like protein